MPLEGPARFQRLMELFNRARSASSNASRARILEEADADAGGALRVELESLLAADASASGVFSETALAAGGGEAFERALEPRSLTSGFVGRYEVIEEIGRGGMGVIYRARDPALEREVALKMVLVGVLASASELERFRREARSIATLEHPHIVPIHEIGEADGVPYFAMKLLEGGSLADRIGRYLGRPREAAKLVADLAGAVEFAHRRDFVHRDLKPANVVFDAEDVPHITDFGLARRLDAQSVRSFTSQVAGTLAYMAPEQADAAPPARAADVYGLGAVLYELLTGRPPFAGRLASELFRQVLEEEPEAPRRLVENLPRDLETICLRCLEKEPRRRYESAAELADDLGRYLRHEPVRARPLSPFVRAVRWSRRRPTLSLLLLIVFLGLPSLGLAWFVSLEEREREIAEREREAHSFALGQAYDNWREGRHERARQLLDSVARLEERRGLESFAARFLRRTLSREFLELMGFGDLGKAGLWFRGEDELFAAGAYGRVGRWALDASESMDGATPESPRGLVLDQSVAPHAAMLARLLQDRESGELRLEWIRWQETSARLEKDSPVPWTVETLRELPGADVSALHLAEDGLELFVASGAHRPSIAVWSLEDAPPRHAEFDAIAPIHTLLSDARTKTLVAVDASGRAQVIGSEDLAVRSELSLGATARPYVAFAREAGLLVGISLEGQTSVRDLRSGTTRDRFGVGDAPIIRAVASGDGRVLALARHGDPPVLELRDLEKGGVFRRLFSGWIPTRAIAFSASGRRLGAATDRGDLQVWDIDALRAPEAVRDAVNRYEWAAVTETAVIAGRRRLAFDRYELVEREGVFCPLRTSTIEVTREIQATKALAPDGGRAAYALPDLSVRVVALEWSLSTPTAREEAVLREVRAELAGLAFGPRDDRPELLAATTDGQAFLWRASAKPGESTAWSKEIELELLDSERLALAISPSGEHALVADWKRPRVTFVSLTDAGRRVSLTGQTAGALSVAFSRDGRHVATASNDRRVRIWDTHALPRSGSAPATRTLEGHGDWALDVEFLPDDQTLASCGDDGVVKLWDRWTGGELGTLLEHAGQVKDLVASPDGRLLVSVGGLKDRFGEVIVRDAGKP